MNLFCREDDEIIQDRLKKATETNGRYAQHYREDVGKLITLVNRLKRSIQTISERVEDLSNEPELYEDPSSRLEEWFQTEIKLLASEVHNQVQKLRRPIRQSERGMGYANLSPSLPLSDHQFDKSFSGDY